MVANKAESPLLLSPLPSLKAFGVLTSNGLLPKDEIVKVTPTHSNPLGLWAVTFSGQRITPNGHPVVETEGIPQLEPGMIDAITHLHRGLQIKLGNMEKQSPPTFYHSLGVGEKIFTVYQRNKSKLPVREARIRRQQGLLHDIGKNATPETTALTNSTRKLTHGQREQLHNHPKFGAEIIASYLGWDHPLTKAAYSHHFMWNGKGYPDDISAQAIPKGARIMKYLDVIDAMADPARVNSFADHATADDIIDTVKNDAAFDPTLRDQVLPIVRLLIATGRPSLQEFANK